jgi:L-lysine 2,3-aminomutase
VVHANHPRELTEAFASAMKKLRNVGCHLYNQAVLLRRINDNLNTLAQLSDNLYSLGVQPYYLHQLDRVQGAAHFEVPLSRANGLFNALLEQLPGYLVPRWVKEVPGQKNKVPLGIARDGTIIY